MPDAAVIIPHYNDVSRLSQCLEVLVPQLSSEVEIVVVDNGSAQSLEPVYSAFPNLKVVVEARPGAAAARNRGVDETVASFLFFLDSDCQPAPDWLRQALSWSKKGPGAGDVVGGAISVYDESPPPRTGAQAFETVFAFQNRRYIEVDGFSVTANLLTRRDVFEATGPFRPGLSEDLDWCRRAVERGYSLRYDGELRVAHPTREDWISLKRKWRRLTQEGFGVNGLGPKARLLWLCRALLVPIGALIQAPKIYRHSSLRSNSERHAALFTLLRLRMQRMLWMLRQAATGRP